MSAKALSLLFLATLLAGRLSAQNVQGLVQPFKSVTLSSPVLQEVIEKMVVEEGDTVEENQVIVQLRHSKEELEVQQAEKIVENAEFVAKGLEALAKDKMGSVEQAMKATTELKLAKIRVEIAKELLKEKTVRSPLAGIVVKKYKETGESVDRAEKMLEIVNIDKLYAQFYVDPKYLQTLQVDQPITVRFPELNNAALTGKISFVDPRIDASSGRFRVKVLMENGDHKVKSGMKADADFSKKG